MNEVEATTQCDPAMARWLQAMVPRSRHRASRAQFAHDLAADHAEQLFQRQQGNCAISGLPFSLTRFDGVLVKHPFAPSLDRISSQGGYTADNVRLVCIAVNFGMGQWGEELYLTFARAAVEHSDQAVLAISMTAGAIPEIANSHTPGQDQARWLSGQRERIAAAETISATLSGKALARQRRRIASLRRNLTLGPAGLKAAAAKAVRTRAG
jgi:hypothetical protein